MTTHCLKISDKYMRNVALGVKKFEVRKDDRNYQVGDTLILNETNSDGTYTGFTLKVEVIYIFGREHDEKKYVKSGYVILGINVINKHRPVLFRN